MPQDTKQGGASPRERTGADRPAAGSVDREPRGEPTPEEHAPPIGQEDEPKGQPTSDRFQTEQAHRTDKKDRKGA
jgi:hypothetical protein